MGKFIISQEIYFESNQEANHDMEINTYHQKIVQIDTSLPRDNFFHPFK